MDESKLFSSMNRRQFLKGTITASAVLAAGSLSIPQNTEAAAEKQEIQLPPLPYPDNALEPYISKNTISFHYGKHHAGYVNNINNLIKGTELEGHPLEHIIMLSAEKAEFASIFNNAAQVWNHSFYWKSMKPNGGGVPSGKLADKINSAFTTFDKFKEQFTNAALTQFGSGWAWLVIDNGSLKIAKTANADTPLAHDQIPLLTIDVWEHAYYLDYQNRRKDYIINYLEHLANWDFAIENLDEI